MRTIEPGESLVYQFTAEHSGIWMYHCGTAPVLHHIGNGMYGAVVIDPPNLKPLDHEYVFVQSELYLSPDGKVNIRNQSGTTHVIADVQGYYSATGNRYNALQPQRILDTRGTVGNLPGTFGAGQTRNPTVTTAPGVPADAPAAARAPTRRRRVSPSPARSPSA